MDAVTNCLAEKILGLIYDAILVTFPEPVFSHVARSKHP